MEIDARLDAVVERAPAEARRHQRSWWSTGWLMPRLLVAIALVDLITRGLPLDAFSFRAWEAMIYYRPPGVAFEPSARYDRWSYGDLANMSNVAKHRVYRRERFTTDAYGFRNPPQLAASGRVRALLIGDSFAVGSGVPDVDTLSAQLTRRGIPTYNVAPMRLTAEAIRAMSQRLGMPNGWVLYEQVTGIRYVYVEAAGVASSLPEAHLPVTFADRFERNLHMPTWPLRIAADRWLKSWQDDRWFPNPHKQVVVERRLVNGDSMLFFPGETLDESLPQHALDAIETTVTLYVGLHEALRPTGLRFAVVLVPDRFAVYAHLIPDSKWPGGMSPFLRELDRRLRAAGVPIVNLHPAMADRATREAESFSYLYWRDDTHWNGRGIATAANEVAAYITASEAQGR